MKKKLSLIIYSLVLVTLISGLYFSLTKTFYQQDEWLGYGLYLANYTGTIWQSTDGLVSIILGQGRILTNLLLFLFYRYFPLNVYPIAIFAIGFHIINTLTVFFLARKIFKNNLSAFLGSLFFALNSVHQSAITWPAASINTLPSTMLILIALIFYFRYLESFKQKWLGLSFIFIYVSLFFKETGIFLFLFIPTFSYFYKKQKIILFLKTYWYFFVVTILIVIFRIFGFISISGESALFLTGSSKYFFDSLAVRSILYPLTSFSLSIIPPDIFLNFARYITNVYYPFIPEGQFILVAQTAVLDLLALVATLVFGATSFILLKFTEPKIRKTVIFWFIFLLASFLPYIIISKSYSYLDSRYYYLASVGWAIIFGWILNLVIQKTNNNYLKVLVVFGFVLFLNFHAKSVIEDIDLLVNESQTRIDILEQLKELKSTLDGNKNVFYVTGDTDYLLPGNKVPFQQGFGYTLMTIYYDGGRIPDELLEDGYLFELGSQGYKEMGDYGFGYFSDKRTLEIDMKRYIIPNESVHYFYYDSTSEKVTQLNDKTN